MVMESQSEKLFARSKKVAPGGVHSPVRAFKSVGGTPIFFERSEGPYLYSVEGRRYLDFCLSFGPHILGHRDADVEREIIAVVQRAWSLGTCDPYSLELAEWITHKLPWVEKIRFVTSGTEAVMSALRVARGATGRDLIVKFDGCYHGHVDSLLVKSGSGLAGVGEGDSAGVARATAEQTLVAPLDDENSVETLFREYGAKIAAIIIEPLPANYGLLEQRVEFLQFLRRLCDQNGSLLIFDEVISGFRVALGGMVEVTGVRPDLVTYGKVMGGGLPVGAYGGRQELMNLVAPEGRVYQAGTLSAHPLGMVAGLATLKKLDEMKVYVELERRMLNFTRALRSGLEGSTYQIQSFGSIFWLSPKTSSPIRSLKQLQSNLNDSYRRLFEPCLQKSIYLAPSGYEVGFISLAHSESLLQEAAEKIIEAAHESRHSSI